MTTHPKTTHPKTNHPKTSDPTTTPDARRSTCPARRRRAHRSLVGLATAAGMTLVAVSVPTVAGAATSTPTSATAPAPAAAPSPDRCLATPKLTARATAEIDRRQVTIHQLETSLAGAGDPDGANGNQVTALQSASSGLAALGERITGTCYTDQATLRSDLEQIFYGYRIYALRVPQTRVIEVADHLGTARTELQGVADRLTSAVGDNPAAQAELDAMNQALASADATLGRPPTLVGAVAEVTALTPAKDLAPTKAALTAAKTALQHTRSDLVAARDHARAALVALGH